MQISTNNNLNEEDEPLEFRMIKDIIKILEITDEENENIDIVLDKKNNVIDIFFQLMKDGYEPRINNYNRN